MLSPNPYVHFVSSWLTAGAICSLPTHMSTLSLPGSLLVLYALSQPICPLCLFLAHCWCYMLSPNPYVHFVSSWLTAGAICSLPTHMSTLSLPGSLLVLYALSQPICPLCLFLAHCWCYMLSPNPYVHFVSSWLTAGAICSLPTHMSTLSLPGSLLVLYALSQPICPLCLFLAHCWCYMLSPNPYVHFVSSWLTAGAICSLPTHMSTLSLPGSLLVLYALSQPICPLCLFLAHCWCYMLSPNPYVHFVSACVDAGVHLLFNYQGLHLSPCCLCSGISCSALVSIEL